jgi:hypothetical protein
MAITPRNNIQIRKLHLTPWSTVPLEKPNVDNYLRNFPRFMEPEGSLLNAQKPHPTPIPIIKYKMLTTI